MDGGVVVLLATRFFLKLIQHAHNLVITEKKQNAVLLEI